MNYWLLKSEPDSFSIDALSKAPKQTTAWDGVRNYQARNMLRDSIKKGDSAFFYHSSCPEPGIAGLAEVASTPYPDPTQFDPRSPYFDAKSDPKAPRWILVDVRALRKTRLVPLSELREHPALAGMRLLARGNRLSITPVTRAEFSVIKKLAR